MVGGRTVKSKYINCTQIQCISLQDRERNWASVKLKFQQLFVQMIQRQTVKFNYRKVFVLYGNDNAMLYTKFWYEAIQGNDMIQVHEKNGFNGHA